MSENISEMMHAGHPQKQAVAAAYAEARRTSGRRGQTRRTGRRSKGKRG